MSEQSGNKPKQQFDIQRLYIRDASLETPGAPQIFKEQWRPEVNLQLNTSHQSLGEDSFEVVLHLTLTTKVGEKTAYLVELQQAGIFTLKGFPDAQMGPMLGAFCPNVLFPYAREALDALITRGGFPPLYLKPVNFDVLYQQQQKNKQSQQSTVPSGQTGDA